MGGTIVTMMRVVVMMRGWRWWGVGFDGFDALHLHVQLNLLVNTYIGRGFFAVAHQRGHARVRQLPPVAAPFA